MHLCTPCTASYRSPDAAFHYYSRFRRHLVQWNHHIVYVSNCETPMTAPRPTPKVVEQTACQFAGRESNNKIVDRVLCCGTKGLVAPRYRDPCQMRTSMSSKWEHG